MNKKQKPDKSDLMMVSLSQFFSIPENARKYLDVVKGNSKVSLRVLDW